jgi:Nif-specific regulatory protein
MAHDDVITNLAFPCQGNRCLTQVLHHIERVDAVSPSRLSDIPITEVPMAPSPAAAAPASIAPGDDWADAVDAPTKAEQVADTDGKPEGERERLIWAMEHCGWVQAKAARLLKISPRQMGYALQKNGIEVRKF